MHMLLAVGKMHADTEVPKNVFHKHKHTQQREFKSGLPSLIEVFIQFKDTTVYCL